MGVPTKSSFLLRWLIVALFISLSAAGRFRKSPRLSPTGGDFPSNANHFSANKVPGGLRAYYYNQTLDHFNYRYDSNQTFQQRYLVDTAYWGGPDSNAPIFAYLGAEAPIENDLAAVGFMYDTAAQFKPLILFMEHRYYGQSMPFGSRERAFSNLDTLGYFDSAQAIADYAEVILHVKEAYNATYSPVIVLGGSYGGMLASWFRLKYPHIAMGALASSAPILYFDNITPHDAYYDHVTRDFWVESENCYRTIKMSFPTIESLASSSNGLSILSSIFRTCQPLSSAAELEDFLIEMFSSAAQYDLPPAYPVKQICHAIDGAPSGTDTLSRIAAGVFTYYARSNRNCYVNPPKHGPPSETQFGWRWQVCSDFAIPMAIGKNSMFPPHPWDLESFIQMCQSSCGVTPRPHWATTYYGGHNINLVLKRFGSNIIFSNGLKDPYSSAGVLRNISDSIVAISTKEGAHCLDILYSRASDPEWLVNQRSREVSIVQGWLAQYSDDLKALKH